MLLFSILLLTTMIPSVDTSSKVYREIFKRGDYYDTTYFSFSTLTYYMLCNTLGFLYVNISSFNCTRKSYFYSFHENKKDFFKTILFSPIFYFLGNNIVLRSRHDLSSIDGEEEYTYWQCIGFNMIWTTFYIIGLEFTHFD